jgi:hypothetical protein
MPNPLPEDKQRAVVRSIWGQYQAWSKAAGSSKGGYQWLRWAVLVLTIAAMIAGPFAKTIQESWPLIAKGLVIAASALFALLAFMNKSVMGEDAHKPWVRQRQLAESLKSLAFQFLGAVPPFDADGAGAAALERATGLVSKGAGVTPQLSDEEAKKEMPAIPFSAESYLKERLDDQVTWYRKKAVTEDAAAKKIGLAGWVIGALVAVSAAINAALGQPVLDIWVPFLSVAATVITTQTALGRRRFLAETYSAAAVKLELAKARWEISEQQPADLQQLVAGSEAVLTGENSAWVEQLLSTPNPPAPPKPADEKE